MSRKPDETGVEALLALAKERNYVANRLKEIAAFIKEKENLEAQLSKINKDMLTTLEEMDCASKGNYGWEGRITWMLAELVRQSEIPL